MQRVRRKDDSGSRGSNLRGVLVEVGGNELDGHVIQLACSLVKGTKTPLYAVHVIEMPWSDAVDDSPADRITMLADRALDRATSTAAGVGYKLEPELLQARAAGAALVDEAADRDCDLIVVGLPYKTRHGLFTMGTTVPYVLEHSPVLVWVVRGKQQPAT